MNFVLGGKEGRKEGHSSTEGEGGEKKRRRGK